MHELTLVQGMLDLVGETAEREGRRIKGCKIGVGELSQFDEKLIRRLFVDLTRGTPLQGARFSIKRERSNLRCLGCGRVWALKDLASQLSTHEREMVHFIPELLNSFARCPSCSKGFFEIEAGRSVRIVEVDFA